MQDMVVKELTGTTGRRIVRGILVGCSKGGKRRFPNFAVNMG